MNRAVECVEVLRERERIENTFKSCDLVCLPCLSDLKSQTSQKLKMLSPNIWNTGFFASGFYSGCLHFFLASEQ
ncbi:hypothetical protein EXN66_Car018831 [Channa argus]|uniref:Uncharacterized protein n=1 Tax=Channa argus TaxID=215402 RepID=A0A6G1QLF5_CHAAH|nr:hypothetical protein EXN66_Car018831 [Channa argus]